MRLHLSQILQSRRCEGITHERSITKNQEDRSDITTSNIAIPRQANCHRAQSPGSGLPLIFLARFFTGKFG